jgi:hypothetical protein
MTELKEYKIIETGYFYKIYYVMASNKKDAWNVYTTTPSEDLKPVNDEVYDVDYDIEESDDEDDDDEDEYEDEDGENIHLGPNE